MKTSTQILLYTGAPIVALLVLAIGLTTSHSGQPVTRLDVKQEQKVEQQKKPEFIFQEYTDHEMIKTITGAVKVEEIQRLTTVSKVDENMNTVYEQVYEPTFTEVGYGAQVYRVTFQDGNTKRYYYQFSRGGDSEWRELDFGPFKN